MRLVQPLKTYLFIMLLALTSSGVVNAKIESNGVLYQHTDHLGSIVAKSKQTINNINNIEWLANNAWGERLKENWDGALEDSSYIPKGSSRGFTDHEHLDGVGLIHMNGRVYDPTLARFMSPDPFVQAPYNTQSYNRYSYVFNNPLSFTDPSGYCTEDYEGICEEVRVVALRDSIDTSWSMSGLGWTYYDDFAFNWDNYNSWAVSDLMTMNNFIPFDDLDLAVPFLNDFQSGLSNYTHNPLARSRFRDNAGDFWASLDNAKSFNYIGFASLRTSIQGVSSALSSSKQALQYSSKVSVPKGTEGGLNLFKWKAPTSLKETGWKEGDHFLNLPNKGNAKANLKQNSSRLREEMRKGNPIYDSHIDPKTGKQITTDGFLNAERNLLQNQGWRYDSATRAYHPPSN